MGGRLLEVAIRPVRIAFLLGAKPSKRLINSVISVNSGLWGGIYNFVCPTDGNAVGDEYLELLRYQIPDCIVLCGRFGNRQNIVRQLKECVHPCFLQKRTGLKSMEEFGIGIEGIFDTKFMQSIRRGTFVQTAVVNPLVTSATLFDKAKFGIPANRIKKYIEDRADFISLTRYRKELERKDSDYDELIGVVEIGAENLQAYRIDDGRRSRLPQYRGFGRLYVVVGNEDRLEDVCYFWNMRAIWGVDRVIWIALTDLASFLSRRELGRAPMLTLTSAAGNHHEEIKDILRDHKVAHIRYSEPKAVLRSRAYSLWESELRTEHISTGEGEFVITASKPSSFELVYPQRYPRWVMDLRLIRDDTIGTEGFVLPNLTYLSDMVTPARADRLQPRIHGDILSLQITSARSDEYIRLRIPTDWEVIHAIFSYGDYSIRLSDQGNYMSRALALFGGLAKLSTLLRDPRCKVIFDEFLKHHRSLERVAKDDRYRRALTLDDMRKAVMGLGGRISPKRKENDFRFIDELLRELIALGAVHSGYVLDCSKCSLEDWYPLDEVAEHFRCRRCLANEIRPLSPLVSFRLNEALYQAYLNNFAVPVLVLDVLQRSTRTSFIFSPQVKLDERDLHSKEIDIVAICDGNLTLGEAKSTGKIKKEQIDCLESAALRVRANRVLLATTSRDSCKDVDCAQCSKHRDYADNAFTHGSPDNPRFWGTKERIHDLRGRLHGQGVEVVSICAQDILSGRMRRDRSGRIIIPTGQAQ
jgi:hypothetical protein